MDTQFEIKQAKRNLLGMLPENLGRRQFLKGLGLLAGATALAPLAHAAHKTEMPVENEEAGYPLFARLKYPGGDWYTDTITGGHEGGAEINLLRRLRKNTLVKAQVVETFVESMTDEIFQYPFLYMSGHTASEFPQEFVDRLRHHISCGGMLLVDDCVGKGGRSFDSNVRKLFVRLFPESPLKQIPISHPVYHTLFDINEVLGGDKLACKFDSGVFLGDRLGIFHCMNDYGCAWEGHACSPGGEAQRDHAFKMGINILIYALTH